MSSHIFKLEMPDYSGAFMAAERAAALNDLVHHSHFQPRNDNSGPYAVRLEMADGRLVLQMRNAQDQDINAFILSLKPYRRLIQDYFLVLESYEAARQHATREKLEAIDMARRALHNEGAELLMTRLNEKIEIDFETARRLFTLICVLTRRN